MTFLCICPQELTSLRRILKTWFGFGSVYMQCAGESMIKTHFEAYLIKAFCSSIGSTLELDSYKKMNKLNNCIWNNTSSQFPAALLNAMKYWFAFITSVTDSITTTFPSCKPGLFDPFLETRPKTINRMSRYLAIVSGRTNVPILLAELSGNRRVTMAIVSIHPRVYITG